LKKKRCVFRSFIGESVAYCTTVGKSAGNAFNWNNVMGVKSAGSTYRLTLFFAKTA